MKTIGKILIILSFVIFAFGVYSFKSDFANKEKDLIEAINDEGLVYPANVEKKYSGHYLFDGLIIGFGAVSLVVGGLLVRKSN